MANDKDKSPPPADAPPPAPPESPKGAAAPQVTLAPPTIIDDPVACCYFDTIPNNPGFVRMVAAVHKSTAPDETGPADLVVYFPDRRITKSGVPYGPGLPGHWGWPQDK